LQLKQKYIGLRHGRVLDEIKVCHYGYLTRFLSHEMILLKSAFAILVDVPALMFLYPFTVTTHISFL
jgi:hypothetical protein